MRRSRLPVQSRPLIAFGVIVAFMVLHGIGLLSPVEQLVSRALAPVQERVFGLGSWLYTLYARPEGQNLDQLKAENTALRAERDQLVVAVAQYKTLLEDQTALRAQSDFLALKGLLGVPARVIGKTLEPNVQMVIINRGSRDQVIEGAPVITGSGILVGRVARVRLSSSDVVLVSDSQSRVAGTLQDSDQTIGVVSGEHGLGIRMELIPQSVPLQPGQVIATAGLEPGMIRGLVIGRVERVDKTSNEAFQTGFLESLVDLHTVSVVTILLPAYVE